MQPIVEKLFKHCVELGASDIHLMVGQPPRFRVQGRLAHRPEFITFDAETLDKIAIELGLTTLPPNENKDEKKIFNRLLTQGSIDGAVTAADGTRYRFNVFRENEHSAVAIRRLDSEFRTIEELGLPTEIEQFCSYSDGLVIVTGPTGSGKSTTLAALVNLINSNTDGFIITIEDPVEFLHPPKRCFVNQRQVGRDARSFNDALVEALRQDPDVILLGELRDLDTMRTALRAAETGHLVFATLHSADSASAIERIISVFPPDEQESVRAQLSMVLRGILSQHLIASPDNSRRWPATELLFNNTAAANFIATGKSNFLATAIETGGGLGMHTLESSLATLYLEGKISERAAYSHTHNPESLRLRLSC